jgi:hypothetical protein
MASLTVSCHTTLIKTFQVRPLPAFAWLFQDGIFGNALLFRVICPQGYHYHHGVISTLPRIT